MKKVIPWLVLVPLVLSVACNFTGVLTNKIISPTQLERPIIAVETPSSTPVPIVYYYFLENPSNSPPERSVVILPGELILSPTNSGIVPNPDISVNIYSALQAMISDPRNVWTSDNLTINSITCTEGAADIALQGEIFGAGDIVLIAARYQILLTVFAEPSVQSAIIRLNGENIANLGISRMSEAKPADFSYSRAEIENFISENGFMKQ